MTKHSRNETREWNVPRRSRSAGTEITRSDDSTNHCEIDPRATISTRPTWSARRIASRMIHSWVRPLPNRSNSCSAAHVATWFATHEDVADFVQEKDDRPFEAPDRLRDRSGEGAFLTPNNEPSRRSNGDSRAIQFYKGRPWRSTCIAWHRTSSFPVPVSPRRDGRICPNHFDLLQHSPWEAMELCPTIPGNSAIEFISSSAHTSSVKRLLLGLIPANGKSLYLVFNCETPSSNLMEFSSNAL